MYEILINEKVGKRLKKFPRGEQKKIKKLLKGLGTNPLPKGKDLKKLQGEKYTLWRIRIGDLRIVYTFSPEDKVLKVVKADFRGKVY